MHLLQIISSMLLKFIVCICFLEKCAHTIVHSAPMGQRHRQIKGSMCPLNIGNLSESVTLRPLLEDTLNTNPKSPSPR